MILDYEPGDKVTNPNNKDWGIGQVQSIIKDKVTVNFENVGKKVINAKNIVPGKTIQIAHAQRNISTLRYLLPDNINDLNEIPSPYLNGMLDEFFEDRWMPVLETNRSCPYRCTFCAWGIGTQKLKKFEY